LLFQYGTEKAFATQGKVPVKAVFNGVPYTGSLMKYRNPLHMLGVPKSIREHIGKEAQNDTIEVVVWRDEEVRTVEVPAQFLKVDPEGTAASSRRKTELHPAQGVLPLDYPRQEGRNMIEAVGGNH
jgi:hypothetical protein